MIRFEYQIPSYADIALKGTLTCWLFVGVIGLSPSHEHSAEQRNNRTKFIESVKFPLNFQINKRQKKQKPTHTGCTSTYTVYGAVLKYNFRSDSKDSLNIIQSQPMQLEKV